MQSKTRTWVSWTLSVIPAALLLVSATMKLVGPPGMAQGFEHLGWPINLAVPLGILEILVTLTYLFPRTAVLGAILVTGYMGGAIATHLRVGDPYFVQFVIGVMVWGGLYLREPRLQSLIPLRS